MRFIASKVQSHTCAVHRIQRAVACLCGNHVQCAVAHLCGTSRLMCGRTPVQNIASNARSHACAEHHIQCAVAHLCRTPRPMRGRTPVRNIASNARSHTCVEHRVQMHGRMPVRNIASNARSHTCAKHRVQCAVAHLFASSCQMHGRTPEQIGLIYTYGAATRHC